MKRTFLAAMVAFLVFGFFCSSALSYEYQYDLLASAGEGRSLVWVVMEDNESTLYVKNDPDAKESEWSYPLGYAGVGIIQFLNSNIVTMVTYEDWHCALYVFDTYNSGSIRKVDLWDSNGVQSYRHFDETRMLFNMDTSDKRFLLVTYKIGEAKKVVKHINAETGEVKNIAKFSSSSNIYLGWWDLSNPRGEWLPVIFSTNAKGWTNAFGYDTHDGSVEKIDSFHLPYNAKFTFCMYGGKIRSYRVDTPLVAEWSPPE